MVAIELDGALEADELPAVEDAGAEALELQAARLRASAAAPSPRAVVFIVSFGNI
ncbi:hypothetical protein [Galactobacter valiniphilus]|uniref:hypothetical protein n=1 Tax=Galactobacter valiniphilus TaxID=2676122 RepID=UPI001313FE51|nr:hypothetical protein [Galactobacter valiniphilus]